MEAEDRKNTPTQKNRKTELDYMKEKQIENLHSNNKILKGKMENLFKLALMEAAALVVLLALFYTMKELLL